MILARAARSLVRLAPRLSRRRGVPSRGTWSSAASSLAVFAAGVALLLASACSLVERPNARRASCLLEGRALVELSGLAEFVEVSGGVRAFISVQNAPPGAHGVFVVEGKSCNDTGVHFNPHRQAHGAPQADTHHAGDLGNLIVDEQGVGTLEIVCDGLSVNDPETTVIGKFLVITERPDDYVTQPAGGSGAKLACGEILPNRR
ncbi:MAG: superoxide dismutase family protein [Planctomycetes bacterium]|nr:superoxide dismutase family protein [Planctomycetota bacterium]